MAARHLQRSPDEVAAHGHPLSADSAVVVLVFLIGAAFWWSVASGQFDDLEGPAHRILSDDDIARA